MSGSEVGEVRAMMDWPVAAGVASRLGACRGGAVAYRVRDLVQARPALINAGAQSVGVKLREFLPSNNLAEGPVTEHEQELVLDDADLDLAAAFAHQAAVAVPVVVGWRWRGLGWSATSCEVGSRAMCWLRPQEWLVC